MANRITTAHLTTRKACNGQSRLVPVPEFKRTRATSPASEIALPPQGARVLMRIMTKYKERLDAETRG